MAEIKIIGRHAGTIGQASQPRDLGRAWRFSMDCSHDTERLCVCAGNHDAHHVVCTSRIADLQPHQSSRCVAKGNLLVTPRYIIRPSLPKLLCTASSSPFSSVSHSSSIDEISTSFAMAQRGEAADYYTGGAPPQQPQSVYQGQPYGQQPPQYGQTYAPPPQGPPPMQQQHGYQQDGYGDNKQSFEQAFKLDKPKYNDLWAGLLFIAVFLGYVAVSAISIRGYGKCSIFSRQNALGRETDARCSANQ
jgi:hypothetical protein